jgi:hypothetical protein
MQQCIIILGNSNTAVDTLLELNDTEDLLIQLFMIMEEKRPTHEEKNQEFQAQARVAS